MRRWITVCFAVAACLCMAAPAVATDGGDFFAKYDMKFWGRVKIDHSYDDVQFPFYNDFLGPVKDSKGDVTIDSDGVDVGPETDWDNDSLSFNPRDTRFGFSASHSAGDWIGKGVFEIDFYGTNAGNNLIPRMRLAYIDLANTTLGTSVRVGQDWIPISRLNPSTIDFSILSATGNLWWRVPQVVVHQKIPAVEGLDVMVGAMMHRRTSTENENREPMYVARLGYDFELMGGKHMVAIGGGYQNSGTDASYTHPETGDDVTSDNQTIDRWLTTLEAKFNIGPFLLKGEAFYGEGIGDKFLRYDMDTYLTDDGDVQEIESRGGWVDLTYKIIPRWSVTAGWGIDDPKDDDYDKVALVADNTRAGDRCFTQNQAFYLNSWYSLTEAIKLGGEWTYMETERKDVDGNHYTDQGNRFTVSMFYAF